MRDATASAGHLANPCYQLLSFICSEDDATTSDLSLLLLLILATQYSGSSPAFLTGLCLATASNVQEGCGTTGARCMGRTQSPNGHSFCVPKNFDLSGAPASVGGTS